jgi:hypothetical protein
MGRRYLLPGEIDIARTDGHVHPCGGTESARRTQTDVRGSAYVSAVHFGKGDAMTMHPIARTVTGWSLILAPVTGLVAAVALPALRSTRSEEITAIAQHQDRFYVYAIGMLVSSYLLVPAFFAITNLMRGPAPRWACLAGGLTQLGLLIAIGDAATELMYWQMGSPDADHGQMVALADRYESALGSSLIYDLGGLAVLAGIVLVSAGLWRTRIVPRWTAVGLALSAVANVAGFAMASQPVLVGSYVVMLAALARIAAAVLTAHRSPVAPAVNEHAQAPAQSLH